MSPAESAASLLPPGLDTLVAEFEQLWLDGRRPALDDLVNGRNGPDRLSLLVELVHVELELRLKAGEDARVEEYLQRYPELAGHPDREWEIIAAEFQLRRRREPGLSVQDYVRRFPKWKTELELLAGESVEPEGRASSPTAAPQIPDYELLDEIGRGALGVVYKARQIKLNRLVALKILLPGEFAGPDERVRFRAEADILASLRHPNIVQVFDVGEHQGRPYLTMELVEGSLKERLAGAPLSARQAAELLLLLARAVQAAHDAGIIHRDLKPANVLLAPGEEAFPGTPKISDFNLAKRVGPDGNHTRTGLLLGTPAYMAPEQAAGTPRSVGPAADIHALGVILYEILTGRPPYRGESTLDTLQQVQHRDPVPPRQLQPRVSRDLEVICLKCLEKAPARRYTSAADLADDLGRFLNGDAIKARPPGWGERVWNGARRHPARTVMVVAVLTLLAGLLEHSRRMQHALDKTTEAEALAMERAAEAVKSAAEANAARYASDMAYADRLFREGDVGQLAAKLEPHIPRGQASGDLRGFEWWLLRRHARAPRLILRAHQGEVALLPYTPDGRSVVTAGGDGPGKSAVKVWDRATGQLRFRRAIRAPWITAVTRRLVQRDRDT
jgi:tRNA A-37 threonylcarbamoyl transferase component Bud32